MKLISIVGATALGLTLCGAVFAADTPTTTGKPQQSQSATPSTSEPVTDGGAVDVQERDRSGNKPKIERDYQAEVKKCDTVSTSDKQKCLDAAKTKRDQM